MSTKSHGVPVLSVVGLGGSGRTTLLEGLIGALVERGWRVATVKHHAHDTDIDVPGKDSWRHERAGAVVTMVSAPNRYGVIRRVEAPRTLGELAAEAGDVDIVLTEGFGESAHARIEIVRSARSSEPRFGPDDLVALVTDVPWLREWPIPVFALGEIDALAHFIEQRYLPRKSPRRKGSPA